MPLDTRIALSGQPLQVQFRDPIASYNQLAQLTSADTQNQLGQMQMSAAQRAMQEEEGAKNFLSGDPDLNTVENQRRLLAFGKTGLGYAKAIAEQKKAGLEGDKLSSEIFGLTQKSFLQANSPITAAASEKGVEDFIRATYAHPVLGALAKEIKPLDQAIAENIAMYKRDPDQWIAAHLNLDAKSAIDAVTAARERANEAKRIASLPPLPGAVPTGTVNATGAGLVVPGTPAAAATPALKQIGDFRIDPSISAENTFKLQQMSNQGPVKLSPNEYYGQDASGKLVIKTIPMDNQLAVAAAPAAAGNVNALTGNEATLQAMAAERKKLTDRLNVLDRMPYSKGVEREMKDKEARLKELNAQVNLRPDGSAITPYGVLTAAAAPSDILRMRREAVALRASGDIAGADAIDNRIKKLNELQDNRTAAQKEQAILDDPNATLAQKATATSQLKKLNELTDNRTASQKEQAVLDDPNSTSAQKTNAVLQLAKLNNIPAKAVDGAIERYEYAKNNSGYKGSFTDFIVLSTPKTNIRVDAGQKAEDVEFGQYVVNQYKEISTRADVATRSLPALDINLKTLEKGFDTGFGTETIAAGAKVLAALGVQNAKDFATDSQTFLANANNAVLQKQLEQKGVQTAADADRITSTGAQLGNTKEANKFIISVAKAQLQRDIDQRKFYSDWRTENKTFKGAEDAWYAGPGSATLFDSPALKNYAKPVAGQTENRTKKLDEIFKKAP